jgi:hypothetical protein
MIPCQVSADGRTYHEVVCLLDTGATVNLIKATSTLLTNAQVLRHRVPKKLILADGSASRTATVTTYMYAALKLAGIDRVFRLRLDIAEVGGPELILGDAFFSAYGVEISYHAKELVFPKENFLMKNPQREVDPDWVDDYARYEGLQNHRVAPGSGANDQPTTGTREQRHPTVPVFRQR